MFGGRWPGWVLALMLTGPVVVAAQERPPPPVELRENYPKPFFPSTTSPFVLYPDLCERGHQPLVSLKIYNVLAGKYGFGTSEILTREETLARLPTIKTDGLRGGVVAVLGRDDAVGGKVDVLCGGHGADLGLRPDQDRTDQPALRRLDRA